MTISYCIYLISISILLTSLHSTEVNKTVEISDSLGIGNFSQSIENSSDKQGNTSNTDAIDIIVDIKQEIRENKDPDNAMTNPNVPLLFKANITNGSQVTNVTLEDGDVQKPSLVNNTTSNIPIHPQLTNNTSSDTSTHSNTDEMPTFDEYRQKLELESKQKREKADSIPSSPTMIVKDEITVKSPVDAQNPKSLNKDGTETIGSIQSINIDSKKPVVVDQTDGKPLPPGEVTDDLKSVARTATLTKKLLKNNVAAKECGAKILDFSREISNADHVLNSNKDEYLNVPCSLSDKWFVVETCEPVQIRSLQISNFEMFSSRPKTFKVYSSDRYPVKHWNNLGLFRAHDEKGIQTFTISDSNMVKYIKFEMVDHYGSEHYCPLTFVRILGNVVIDEIDEETEYNDPLMDDDVPVAPLDEKASSDGLLMKAKDIIVKMVNGIGGSKKESNQLHQDMSSNIGKSDIKSPVSIVSESPCLFIDFITKEMQINWENILLNFHRFLDLEKHLALVDNNMTLDDCIASLPFPLQIRSHYFTIQRAINHTSFPFLRLYRSFSNLSTHSKIDVTVGRPLRNLSVIFKCNLFMKYDEQSLEPSSPKIPHVMLPFIDNSTHKTDDTKETSTVKVPDGGSDNQITSKDYMHSPQQHNQQNPSLPVPPVLSSLNDTVSNESSSIPLGLNQKNNTNVDGGTASMRLEKVTPSVTKESESEETNMTKSANTQSKNPPAAQKTDEMLFDQKLLASAGSNAWNQAFMRIKNMARQLELNVSISMKYLEELSQNYKTQTDRLKRAQLATADNVSQLEQLIHQQRQETHQSIHNIQVQLHNLALKIKYKFSSRRIVNSTDEPQCIDILPDELFEPSWADSPLVLVFINVAVSMLCNLVLISLVYNRLKLKILSDLTKSIQPMSTPIPYRHNSVQFGFVEEDLSSPCSSSRSCSDLTVDPALGRYRHPVVMPPRGVNLSFTNQSDNLSEQLGSTHHTFQNRQLGPHYYPVQPNLNFVTPSKERKKKRKK